jgi:peptidoglycan/xylan/chitin deacetylase (PgdA/CDA1 family)
MIASLKRSSLAISKHIGLSGLLAHSEWRRRRLLVLCYHGIALHDEDRWDPGLYVSQQHFERRLALLRRNECTVLPLREAVERLYRGDLPDRAVALTFDDGYYDFLARAWPVLQAAGYPATVYLTTARVEHNFPIVNLLVSYVLWKARDQVLDGTGLFGLRGQYVLADADERARVVREMNASITAQAHTAEDKDMMARAIVTRLGLDYDALAAARLLRLMRREEISALSRQGVDFQLHTHLHRTPEDPDVFVRDVLDNRDRIQAMTGLRPEHLCYPSGMYRMGYLPALRREGIVSATTCDPGMADRTSEPLLLPRFVDTTGITDIEFEGWVTGVASCLPRRTRRAHPAIH